MVSCWPCSLDGRPRSSLTGRAGSRQAVVVQQARLAAAACQQRTRAWQRRGRTHLAALGQPSKPLTCAVQAGNCGVAGGGGSSGMAAKCMHWPLSCAMRLPGQVAKMLPTRTCAGKRSTRLTPESQVARPAWGLSCLVHVHVLAVGLWRLLLAVLVAAAQRRAGTALCMQ